MTVTDIVLFKSGAEQRLWIARSGWLAGYKPTTRETYQIGLDQWILWCRRCGIDALDVERPHIDFYGRWLEEERCLQPATVQQRLCILRSFYRYCEDEKIISHNPAARVRLPKVSQDSRTHGMTRDEIIRFLSTATRNPVQHALVCLLTLNGLRVSEACNTNVEDLSVEYGHRTLTVVRKGGKRQTIPLAAKTARVLDLIVGERTTGPLLITQAGKRMTRHLAGDIVDRIGKRAGLPYHCHPHQLRHAFATTALDAGVPLHDVQDSMAHADPRTTMRYARHRHSLDKNATHIVTVMLSGG